MHNGTTVADVVRIEVIAGISEEVTDDSTRTRATSTPECGRVDQGMPAAERRERNMITALE